MELEPCGFLNIFLKFWLFEPHFHINFSYRKTCTALLKHVDKQDSQSFLVRKRGHEMMATVIPWDLATED